MRPPSLRRVLLVLAVVAGSLLTSSGVGVADDDHGPIPGEAADRTTPSTPPPDTRPTTTAATAVAGEVSVFAAPAGLAIEDFWYDELKLEGKASEVCAGRLLTGTAWTFNELVERFGGTAGTMYSCRERWDAANNPDCNGTVVNPVTSPNFTSTCWSNHARGRALDVMVGGTASGGYNRARGLAIVNWLLASDANGNVNANARKLGVQQILFGDRCWNSDGDRGIANWSRMRQCGIGHHDHVHIDLTEYGAAGAMSYWGGTMRPPAPKFDTQVFYDRHGSWRQVLSWWNLRTTDEEGLALPVGYSRPIVGDWDSNGEQGEIFLWNPTTGDYFIQEWNDGDSLNARMGNLRANDVVAGDFDTDGEVDDMFFWSAATGQWAVWSWDNYEPRFRVRGVWSTSCDDFTVGDFDGDGRFDDMHVWDHDTGAWNVFSWQSFRPTYQRRGVFHVRFDELIVGDWSAGGDLDEALLWDRQLGTWILYSWSRFRLTWVNQGSWDTIYDIAAPGDYDTDGRVDDLYLYDTASGIWSLYSYHRNSPTRRTGGDWAATYDVISVGPFNEL
jgi:hypothetical protein